MEGWTLATTWPRIIKSLLWRVLLKPLEPNQGDHKLCAFHFITHGSDFIRKSGSCMYPLRERGGWNGLCEVNIKIQ